MTQWVAAVPDSFLQCYRRRWFNHVYGSALALDDVGSAQARKARLVANLAAELAAVPLLVGLLVAPLAAVALALLHCSTGVVPPPSLTLLPPLASVASLVASALNLVRPTTATTATRQPELQ